MGVERFIVWITCSIILVTILPHEKSPIMSVAQESTTLSSAASSFGTALSDTYTEVAAIKQEEFQFIYKTLRMSLGLLTNLLGRSLNGVGTSLDLASNGLGAVRSYSETGTGFLADGASSALRYGSTALGAAGQATKDYGTSWIDLQAAKPAAAAAATANARRR